MKSSINGMAERYRAMLAGPDYIELLGCHDVLSALIAQAAGYSAVFLSGYGVAASAFGNPDIGLTTLTETSLAAKNMISRVSIPVVVDVDNGYGNEDNVVRTIREMEFAGAAGIVMEDQVLPKRCGHTAGKKILPLPNYLRKLEYALQCRETPLVVVARTDAPMPESIDRAIAYRETGADVVLIDGVGSLEALKQICARVPGHKQVNLIYGGMTPILSAPDLSKIGFKVVLYSTPTLFIATKALWEALPRMHRAHDLGAVSDVSVDFNHFQSFVEGVYQQQMRAAVPDAGDTGNLQAIPSGAPGKVRIG